MSCSWYEMLHCALWTDCVSVREFEADGAKVEMRWATRVVLVRWGLAPGSVGERDERVCCVLCGVKGVAV